MLWREPADDARVSGRGGLSRRGTRKAFCPHRLCLLTRHGFCAWGLPAVRSSQDSNIVHKRVTDGAGQLRYSVPGTQRKSAPPPRRQGRTRSQRATPRSVGPEAQSRCHHRACCRGGWGTHRPQPLQGRVGPKAQGSLQHMCDGLSASKPASLSLPGATLATWYALSPKEESVL